MDYAADRRISAGLVRHEGRMLNRLTRTLVKVVVASIIVGTILAHFGITADHLMTAAGLSSDRVTEFARAGMAWALPNLMLGAVVIVPLWFIIYLFRPPGESRD
jgi:di/tricarboxylate transporter